jgi:hypothetical protein
MSYGYYSLNNLSSISGSVSQTIIGEDPVIVETVGTSSTISLYESSPDYINFASFNKSLRVIDLYAENLTGPAVNNLKGATGSQGPTGSQGLQGPTGSQGPTGAGINITDPFVVNNLRVNNFMSGTDAEFSGYIVAENIFGAENITAPFISSTRYQGEHIDSFTGTIREYLEIPPWKIGTFNTILNPSNQLQIINENSALPTLSFIPSLQNGFMLSNTILPSDNTKTLGDLGSKWSEGHFKKIFVDGSTIEFNQLNSSGAANATIKSQYINETIDTILGPINLQGNNIESEYISATGVFSVYNTSTVSTTLELSARDLFVDSINGLRRDISIIALSGAGNGSIVSITGSNVSGSIQVFSGTGCAKNFGIVEIPFIYTYINSPSIVLQNASQSTARLLGDSQIFVDSIPSRFIIYSGNTPLRDLTYYKWFYQVVG